MTGSKRRASVRGRRGADRARWALRALGVARAADPRLAVRMSSSSSSVAPRPRGELFAKTLLVVAATEAFVERGPSGDRGADEAAGGA